MKVSDCILSTGACPIIATSDNPYFTLLLCICSPAVESPDIKVEKRSKGHPSQVGEEEERCRVIHWVEDGN